MTKQQQAQLLEIDQKLLQLKNFIDSLYYPGVNSKDFEVVRNRFNQLFPSVSDLMYDCRGYGPFKIVGKNEIKQESKP